MSSPSSVTFVLEDGDGNRVDQVVPGPGGVIRLAVGTPERHSGIWRIWAGPKVSDVYIAIRSIVGFQKWSLHESGNWHFAWVNVDRAMQFTQRANRFIRQWAQPPELPQTGWTKAFSISVRHQDLTSVPDELLPKDVIWVPPPDDGHSLTVHIVIARPDQPWMRLEGSLPVPLFMLADGGVVLLVVSKPVRVTDDQNEVLAAVISQTMQLAPSDMDLPTLNGVRMLTVGETSDGGMSVWDLALASPGD